jgi:C-methyltransferase-like protein/methyltransferase family protein/putative zinc binding protein
MFELSNLLNLETSGKPLIDLGLQPVSNRFVTAKKNEKVPEFDFKLRLCEESGLIHLANPFPVEALKPNYDWLTCFEPEDHLDDMVKTIISLPGINKQSLFGAYSFKDDSTLERLIKLGYKNTWRIQPDKDLGITDKCANVETYQSVLNDKLAEKIILKNSAADVFIVRHVVEHAYNLPAFLSFIKKLIKPGGYIIWELPDCERALQAGDCTTLWEEHVFYFTRYTFKQVMTSAGLSIQHYESVPYPLENSIIAITQLVANEEAEPTVDKAILSEEIARAKKFAETIQIRRESLRSKLEMAKKKYGSITLFGAGHLSVAFLSIMNVEHLFDFVIDDNENKKGMNMPIGELNIVGSEHLYDNKVGLCLLSLNPHNQPKVIEKHQRYIENGGLFASIFPSSENYLETIL